MFSSIFRTRLLPVTASVLLALFAGSGCHQDMLKATPFAGGEHAVARGSPEGRVNLWPLFYHREPATSFLWPFGEITDTTWALRPLVARYGNSIDVLWPFIHLEESGRRGHVLPLVWWTPEWVFALPSFYRDEETLSLLPFFHREDSETAYGIWTLLYGRGGRRNGTSAWLYTPAYFFSRAGDRATYALPPLLSWWRHHGAEGGWRLRILLNAIGSKRIPGVSGEHVVPFYWREHREERHGDAVSDLLLTLPLYAGWDRVDPGWRKRLRVVPPLLWASYRSGPEGADGESPRVATDVYGPFYISARSGEARYRVVPPVLWASYRRGLEEERPKAAVDVYGPFYVSGHSGDDRYRIVPALLSGFHDRGDGGRDWHLLLSTIAWGGSPEERFSRILPFYYHSRSDESGRLGFPFALWGRWWSPEERGWYLFPFVIHREWEESHRTLLLLGLGRSERSPSESRAYFFPFFFWRHSELGAREPGRAGGEGGSDRDAPAQVREETSFRLLLFLFDRFERRSGGESYRRTRVLWRLWHDEQVGETRSLDVFPFFTYDREGEDSFAWSWLYTFLRYRREGGRRSLNLFFLPAIRWGGKE